MEIKQVGIVDLGQRKGKERIYAVTCQAHDSQAANYPSRELARLIMDHLDQYEHAGAPSEITDGATQEG